MSAAGVVDLIAASVVKDGKVDADATEFGRVARKGMEDILDAAARQVGRGENAVVVLASLGDSLGILIDTISGAVKGWQTRARNAEVALEEAEKKISRLEERLERFIDMGPP